MTISECDTGDFAIGDSVSVVTANRRGRTSTELNELSQAFVEFAATASGPVLDIGCAYGVASVAALRRGASVTAVDVGADHLDALARAVSADEASRLQTMQGSFPSDTDFPDATFSAIHASNLLNFLSGSEIEAGSRKITGWLRPGGRLFVISGTPYARNIRGFIAEYERRRASGALWPGECECLSRWSNDPTIAELPDFLHLLDDVVLIRTFADAGLDIIDCRMFHRRNTPAYLTLDGRENVMLIAVKPDDGR